MTNTEHKYRITNSSGLQGGAWSEDYESQADAADALAQTMGWDDIVLSDSFADSSSPDRDGWAREDAVCAYSTQEECDDDEEGAYAPRIVCLVRKAVQP